MTMLYAQLELFPETKEERNSREIEELRRYCDKLRKSLHARHGGLEKSYSELKNELEQLKASICKNQKINQEQGTFL